MSSASHHYDDKPPRPRLPRPPEYPIGIESTPATPFIDVLGALPMGTVATSAPHHRDNVLCDTNETQELLDNFFALYAPPDQGSASAQNAAHTEHRRVLLSDAEGMIECQHSDAVAKNANADDDNDDADREDDDDVPVGRTDGHHAQQSQYVPVEEEEEEEEEVEESSGDAGEDGGNDERLFLNVEEVNAEGASDDSSAETAESTPSPSRTKGLQATADLDSSARSHHGPSHSAAPSASTAASSSPTACRNPEVDLWPFAHPPPPTALPLQSQTRAAFHTKRYGAFIKAYLGLSDQEVRQAERRGRGICMIGVRKVTRYGKGAASSPISYSFSSPRLMATCKGVPSDPPNHPFRCVRPSNADPVRTQRVFLRHSVLAVEGDAVFCQLIDRAETLYAVEQQRLDYAAAAAAAVPVARSDEIGTEGDAKATETNESKSVNDEQGKQGIAPVLYPQFRKLPRVTEPYLCPNARCIALHYGLPDPVNAPSGSNSSKPTVTGAAAPEHRFPRATLIAVVSTTRLEDNTEIYVSMESYYRCLDEIAWYRRCYSHLNARYGCRASLEAASSTAQASCCPTPPLQGCQRAKKLSDSAQTSAEGTGDVYTGVKRFPAWPAELAYYHGVGKRHVSRVAEGAFPFTLVDLGAAPELGEGQKGVTASLWIPYGTCLLYCGPSVATRKVEKLVTARVLGGHTRTRDPAKVTAENGRLKSSSHGEAAPQHVDRMLQEVGEVEAEDLSFVTDDTYALGLGRHGVCFGQGLTRYINHRYNISRFGNVELCSVMLSVPSEFCTEATGGGLQRNASSSSSSSPPPPAEARRPATGAPSLPSDPALTEEENRQIRAAVRRQYGRHGAGGGGLAADAPATSSTGAQPPPRGKRRQAALRRAPRFFLEEKSFFVTVPFFLVTTDIAPGASLLAWTYGEDYDARLERQAVADGHIVPYADAAVLNRRLAMPSPGRRFQRYGGDYRFAVGVGDVVWRRRPLLQPPALPRVSQYSGAAQASPAGGFDGLHVPLPEEDLFAVVQTQRGSVEQLLLQPLTLVDLTDAELGALLREQCLYDYVSPHVSFSALAAMRAEKQCPQRRVGGRGGKRRQTMGSKERHASPAWSRHWAVFQLPNSPIASEAATLPLARAEDALRRCSVATVESVGLLLPDVDYSVIHTKRPENRGGGGARGPPGRKGAGGGGTRAALDSSSCIAVNLDDLHHSTHLVRTSAERATALPVLLNGLLWPLFSAHVERGGGPTGANGGSRGLPTK
ncbi:hypothetical protein ABL78_7639 [Leptomonas seymouri]|uniref:Uncharacterized protein n=1 Tax=Leptomonas seymouri TaxID=5684 RepID=A0A0N1I1N9_LEPSE|nr:hypothetical protein ABL78_7639 [Leptomonas seymouri]|eukprot:KPI83330.1 hypothetical protein ABL78_7639 [Leptomonas seymouri]